MGFEERKLRDQMKVLLVMYGVRVALPKVKWADLSSNFSTASTTFVPLTVGRTKQVIPDCDTGSCV